MSHSSMAMVHMHINVTEEKAKYKRLQSCTNTVLHMRTENEKKAVFKL